MLDIHQLNVFLVAAETLNFTQAAQRLHMTQPSVSQHVQTLERHFKTPLFNRSGRSLELTEAGMTLIPLAREAVSLSIRIEETMETLKGDIYGHLHVGCSTTPGKYVLPQLLAQFHRRYPKVRVTCQVTSQPDALRMLSEGQIHFALTSLSGESSPDLELHHFLCDHVVLIAPLNHPWAQRDVIGVEELKTADVILREESSGTYTAVRDELAKSGVSIEGLNTLLTLGNAEAIALSVQEGIGVGFVSEMVVERLGQGQVVPITISEVNICRDIHIVKNIRRPATAAQNAFWDFIHSDEFSIAATA